MSITAVLPETAHRQILRALYKHLYNTWNTMPERGEHGTFQTFLDKVGLPPTEESVLTRHDPSKGWEFNNLFWKSPPAPTHRRVL